MVDPEIWLPGIYIARVVATLKNDKAISTGAHGSPRWSEVPLGSKDAEKLNSPCGKFSDLITLQEKAGYGESQPELPPNNLRGIAVTSLQGVAIGLQEQEESFLPVENVFGNHTDTDIHNSGRKGTKIKHTGEIEIKELWKQDRKIIEYVPVQIINLSLEEIQLPKHMYVGLASPTEICVGTENKNEDELARVQGVLEVEDMEIGDKSRNEIVFELYLNEKLGHLTK
jgi:hypothetical protein